MSRTLNLVERLLERGRTLQQHGQTRAALDLLSQLAAFRLLSPTVSEELHRRLAEMHLQRRSYRRACRHLTVLLRYQPDNPEYHYRLAKALRARDRSHWERAAEHYTRALELDPTQPEWLADAGLLDIRLGHVEQGLRRLREAVDLKPNDPVLLQRLVRGLRWANQPDEARTALRTALFRNRFDPRFQECWRDYQFRQSRQDQLREQRANQPRAEEDAPVLLPFIRVIAPPPDSPLRGTILRKDGSGPLQAPHHKRSTRGVDQRNIQ